MRDKNWIADWKDMVKNINESKKSNKKTRSATPSIYVDMKNSTYNITIGGDIYVVPKRQRDNNGELIAANILLELALNFCNRSPSMSLEDSFSRNIVSGIFEAVFLSNAVLSYQWANGYLKGSDKYIPDYILLITHSQDRYHLVISELKAPTNKTSIMLLNLIKKKLMDLANLYIYRALELSSATICNIRSNFKKHDPGQKHRPNSYSVAQTSRSDGSRSHVIYASVELLFPPVYNLCI